MSRPTFNLPELKASGFNTNDRRYLAKAYELGVGYPPDTALSIEQIRDALFEVWPETRNVKAPVVEQPPAANVTPIASAAPAELRKMPNLSGNGVWEGKKRRIMYTRQTQAKYEDALPVRWEESFFQLPHGKAVDVPYPFYHSVLSATDVSFTTEIVDDKGPGVPRGAKYVEKRDTSQPKYNIQDFGDTPGTEHLPENYGDFFRQVARKTNMLKGVARAWLLRIHTILFGVTPITELVHVSDEDIRLKIATRLGPEFEQLMADELYGSAVA